MTVHELCQHEPTITITSGAGWLEAVICACRKCGRICEFPLAGMPDRDADVLLFETKATGAA